MKKCDLCGGVHEAWQAHVFKPVNTPVNTSVNTDRHSEGYMREYMKVWRAVKSGRAEYLK